MSDVLNNAAPRKRGRPSNAEIAARRAAAETQDAAPVEEAVAAEVIGERAIDGTPCAKQTPYAWQATPPASWLEQHGGDVIAWDTIPDAFKNRGKRIASHTDMAPGAVGQFLPDLSPPGMIVLKDDPTQKFRFAMWDDNPRSDFSRFDFGTMVQRGFRPVTASEFYIHPDMQLFLAKDDSDRITFSASKAAATVIMAQPEAAYRRFVAINNAVSDTIQKTAEEVAAIKERNAQARDLGLGGVEYSPMTVEDDWAAHAEFNRR